MCGEESLIINPVLFVLLGVIVFDTHSDSLYSSLSVILPINSLFRHQFSKHSRDKLLGLFQILLPPFSFILHPVISAPDSFFFHLLFFYAQQVENELLNA